MIQTKEELFIAELGGNPQQEIELSYGAKIKITDLLSKYLKAINYTHCCESDSELLFKLRDNCVNGIDDEVCRNSGICKYCS